MVSLRLMSQQSKLKQKQKQKWNKTVLCFDMRFQSILAGILIPTKPTKAKSFGSTRNSKFDTGTHIHCELTSHVRLNTYFKEIPSHTSDRQTEAPSHEPKQYASSKITLICKDFPTQVTDKLKHLHMNQNNMLVQKSLFYVKIFLHKSQTNWSTFTWTDTICLLKSLCYVKIILHMWQTNWSTFTCSNRSAM